MLRFVSIFIAVIILAPEMSLFTVMIIMENIQ